MDMIIAILLWMQVMCGGGVYPQPVYDQMVQTNEPTINMVLKDPVLSNQVWDAWGREASTVVVLEDEEL